MLENKIIISTRPLNSDDQLINLLQKEDAKYLSMPMIAIEATKLTEEDKNVLLNIDQFDWIVFTSRNGVRFFFEQMETISPGKILSPKIKTAVVGNSTKNELRKFGIESTLLSSGKTSVELLEQLGATIGNNAHPRIALALGTLAGPLLEEGLDSLAIVTRINVYKTIAPKKVNKPLLQKIRKDDYDIIILASPSAVDNLDEILTLNQLKDLRMAVIGPSTEKRLLEKGVSPLIVAERSSAEGLFESVKKYFQFNNIK